MSARLSIALAGIAAAITVSPAAAQDARRFNLECRELDRHGVAGEQLDHVFSVDLDAREACRRGNPHCAPVVDHGRWLELSYTFGDGDRTFEMFRLYDRRTGWLDQVIREGDAPGRSYGDAVCEVRPFDDLRGTD